MTLTVVRDNLLETDDLAEVFWFNCRECGEPITDEVKRTAGFCSAACLGKERKAGRPEKKRQLMRLLGMSL